MSLADAMRWLRAVSTVAPGGCVELERHHGVATLWLDHDDARNALTVKMMAELADHVGALEADPPRMWVLRARGRSFCAGGHLGDVRASLATPLAGRRMALVMADVLGRLEALPSVGVVFVHGAAVGGGAELAVLGDLCIVQQGAVVSFAQAERGVACGWGGAQRLVDRIGAHRAADVLLLRPQLSAQRMQSLGLGVATDNGVALVQSLGDRVRDLPPAVVRAVVDAVRGCRSEVDAFASVWGQPDHIARLSRLPWGRR